jgi:hypothetical protein
VKEMLQTITRNFINTIVRNVIGIFGLPLILLYTIAYRLVGVHTTYQWGDIDVRPTTSATQGQFLFSRLFPALVAICLSAIVVWVLGIC